MVYEIATESHKTEDNLTPIDMLRHGNLCKTLNLWFAWIMACVSYYALSLNAADLSGNIILNYLLSQLISIPGAGITSFAINKIGRKFTLGMLINYILETMYGTICCTKYQLSVKWLHEFLVYLAKTCKQPTLRQTRIAVWWYSAQLSPQHKTSWHKKMLSICCISADLLYTLK